MKTIFSLFVAMALGVNLNAQEKTSKIHIKMEKDGVVFKDTVYEVDDEVDPEMVSRILDITLGDSKSMDRVFAFSGKDGKLHEHHMDSDSPHVWHMKSEEGENYVYVTTDEDGEKTKKVIVKTIKTNKGDDKEWTNDHDITYKLKSDSVGEEVYEIKIKEGDKPQWIEADGHKVLIMDAEGGSAKKIKVISEGEGDYEFTTEDGEVIIIKTEEKGGEKEVKVEVIREDDNKEKKENKKASKKPVK